MFEYMGLGVPAVVSNFDLYRAVVEGHNCGIAVDPTDPHAIAEAIRRLIENPEIARAMGENGRRAVIERYNWATEKDKLLQLYDELLK
jgi:glycosyltransferase involved in cell wall biosynthesis